MSNGAAVIVLTTTGRRSGNLRKTPLIRVPHEDGYIAIASMGGARHHPAWYLNLVADPHVGVQDGDRYTPCVARITYGTERDRLWRTATAVWPEYNEYQAVTQRQIPVVDLQPA